MAEKYHLLKILGLALSLFALLGAGYLFGKNRGRWKCLLLSIGYELVFFSMGTRRMAIAPIIFFLGMLLGHKESRSVRIAFFISIVLAPVLSLLALLLRTLPDKGLIPFAYHLMNRTELLSPYIDSLIVYIFQDLFRGILVTGYVMTTYPLDINYFFISINPLPGFLLNWSEVAKDMLVNSYTPYNTFGELLNYGLGVACGYFFIVGVYFSHIDKKLRVKLIKGEGLFPLAFISFCICFILFSNQYHLRTATRFLYYSVFLEALWVLWARMQRHQAFGEN